MFLLGKSSPRRRRIAGLGVMLLVFFVAGVGCGGGSGSSNNNNVTPGTPAGSYNITVTATSGAVTHSANVLLTVQ
jgi:hypothetical protein